MQRVDHPDPAAANAQALDDLENGATGLTLVFAGSVSANGYGLDASPQTLARVLDGVALDAITIDFNLSPPTRAAVQHFAALVTARGLAPKSIDMRASINPIGGFAASGTSPQPWSALSQGFAKMVGDAGRARLCRPLRGRRRTHHPQCRRLGGAGTGLRACRRGRLSARARGRRPRARCRALHDLFPALGRRRRVPHHRQVPGVAEIVGARRAGLRAGAEAGLCRGRDRLAHDDAARCLREHAAHHHRHHRRRPCRRRQHHRLALHGGARPARPFRPPGRAQYAAHSSGGVASRQGRRSGRRLRRAGRSDAKALRRRLGHVAGDRRRGRRLGRARSAGSSSKRSRPSAPSGKRPSRAARMR